MRLYAEMTETELERVDLVEASGLKIGDRVTHVNAGQFAGSGPRGIQYVTKGQGTILGHQNQGLHHWGGLCVTVTVQWDDGETYDMVSNLARKVG